MALGQWRVSISPHEDCTGPQPVRPANDVQPHAADRMDISLWKANQLGMIVVETEQ